MANDQFYSDAEEQAEFEDSMTKDDLRRLRGVAKARHTRSLKKLRKSLKNMEDRDELKVHRALIVRDYDAVLKMHERYMKTIDPVIEPNEAEYMATATSGHLEVLQDVDEHMNEHYPKAPTPSLAHRSSSKFRKYEEERIRKEGELKKQHERFEAEKRIAEEKELALNRRLQVNCL